MRINPTHTGKPPFSGEYRTPLLLTAVVWLCSVPLIIILAIPFVGPIVAAYVIAVALVAALAVCFVYCRIQKTR